jgi:hypothetical protein
VYDGYLELVGAASAQALDPCATTPAEQDPRRAVMRREVPFVVVMAQTQSGATQAEPPDDSEETGGEYRLYQIAGTSSLVSSGAGRPAMADLAIAGVDAQGQLPCADAFGTTMWSLALEAIWWQLRERIAAGTPMNREPRIGKDAADHVIGGWRLPQVDLPLADESQSSSACSPAESGRRYDAVRLKQLYGSRGEYLRRFQAAVDAAVQARRLTSESGAALKASIASSVPAF